MAAAQSPVADMAVEVFPGDVGDPETLPAQIVRIRSRFGIEYVVFVGDRGMVVNPTR